MTITQNCSKLDQKIDGIIKVEIVPLVGLLVTWTIVMFNKDAIWRLHLKEQLLYANLAQLVCIQRYQFLNCSNLHIVDIQSICWHSCVNMTQIMFASADSKYLPQYDVCCLSGWALLYRQDLCMGLLVSGKNCFN